MSWVWLDPPQLDFGGHRRASDCDEQTIWLRADPLSLLELPLGSSRDAIRRAYRRQARRRHPDTSSSAEFFEVLQRAYRDAIGNDDPEVSVQPTAGAWWSLVDFVRAGPADAPARSPAIGLVFELHDLAAVPLRRAEDILEVSYRGELVRLPVRYSRSAAALPVLIAKAAALISSTVLVSICVLLIPVFALALSFEGFLLSNGNVWLFWFAIVATVGTGYGVLAVVLAAGGKSTPFPRRAIARLRRRASERFALPRGQS